MTIEQISKLIDVVRSDLQKFYNLHQLSVQSGGTQGLRCFNPEELERKINRTDKEILDDLIAKGAIIDGIDEYLDSLNK